MSNSGAIVSDCGLYRFSLWRECEPDVFNGLDSACLFVMNNPSTADATADDPTIRRVRAFAAAWGFHKVYVGNTNPYRATNPKLALMPPEKILEQNDTVLRFLVQHTQWTVAAWGEKAKPGLAARALAVLTALRPVRAIALTKGGHPKHPLYLPKDARASDWKARVCQKGGSVER